MVFRSRMSTTTNPISEKKLAANRANATKSTGPRTPEGKLRSAQNSRKHGFAASKFVAVRLEELDEFAYLSAKFIAAYRPVNDLEIIAVERIALAQHSLYRIASLEAGLTTAALNETIAADGLPCNILSEEMTHDFKVTQDQNRALCFAIGFERMIIRADSWKFFFRYQAQAERLYRRAVEEFERLKALRHELPDEPTDDAQLEEIAAAADPLTNPPGTTEPFTPLPSMPPGDPTIGRSIPLRDVPAHRQMARANRNQPATCP